MTDDRLSIDWSAAEPEAEPGYRGRRRAQPVGPADDTEPVRRADVLDALAEIAPAAPKFQTRAEAKAAWAAEPAKEQARGRSAADPVTARTMAPVTAAPPALAVGPATTVLPTRPSPNVRRAPQLRGLQVQPEPQSRHRGLAIVGALAAVAAMGVAAVAGGALPTEAADQAATSLSPRSPSAAGSALDGTGSQPSTEQSTSQLAGGTLDKAFRMVAVSRSQERGAIAGCSGKAPTQSYSNGELPTSILCSLPFAPRHRLRADAAVQLIRLNDSYKGRFGQSLCLTDSYRSLASQYSVAARKPGLAARPGTSEHGWGLAVDVCDGPDQTGGARRSWFLANAPKFGWDNPAWARPGTGSRPEPWHWEFVEGESKTQASGE
ncbi:D-alanyl-D-alanine carboxypeptidase family protein [Angustibacter sp. McL0619]|uniref:M15 family metallopeptidase n=1 Tax=Angustibacter sp. McL0619 TaxID=3415676 RepID=UPI003CE76F2C